MATDPNNLVKTALSKVRDLDIKNGDMVWCLFDVDHHTDKEIQKAKKEAGTAVNICLSNPCFDLWILLHFCYHSSNLSSQEAKHEVRTYLPSYSKKESFDKLKGKTQTAIDNAKKLNQMHTEKGIKLFSTESNPSTQVFELVEYVLKTTSKNKKN